MKNLKSKNHNDTPDLKSIEMHLEKSIDLNTSKKLSKKTCKRTATQTKRHFQNSIRDSELMKPLRNSWEYLCHDYQIRGFISIMNKIVIMMHVDSLVGNLADYEIDAICLQIQSQRKDLVSVNSSSVESFTKYKTIGTSDYGFKITEYITEEYIYKRVKSYTNKRLEQAVSTWNELWDEAQKQLDSIDNV